MDSESLFAAAQAGAWVICANQRTQRRLLRLYDAWQLSRLGGSVKTKTAAGAPIASWLTPSLLSWSAWLDGLWQELLLTPDAKISAVRPLGLPEMKRMPLRLNAAQEQLLWERVVANSASGRELLAFSAAAELAREAWLLLQQYCFGDRAGISTTEEGAAFNQWADAFLRACEANHWIDPARVPSLLAAAVEQGTLEVRGPLIFVGFDVLTPQQEKLIAALRGRGCRCDVADWPEMLPPRRLNRLECSDANHELEQAAHFARARLTANPAAEIGIIVPDLPTLREPVERVFTEVLAPEALLQGPSSTPLFEISLGRPLVRYPIIHAALQLLRWFDGPLPIAEAGELLRSPYLAEGALASAAITALSSAMSSAKGNVGALSSEAARRALLHVALCRLGAPEITLDDVSRSATELGRDGKSYAHSCPGLASSLRRARRPFRPEPQAPGSWSKQFSALLSALGWPGDRTLDRTEYQTCEAWSDVLRALASLDCVQPTVSLSEALAAVTRLAEPVFQAENLGASVQVLGPLEAAGSRFDHLWITGADEERWPARPHPNPLLPVAFQRHWRMPHAGAADDLEFARRVVARLRQSAGEVVFSSAHTAGEQVLHASPLIVDVPECSVRDVLPQPPETWMGNIAASASECRPWQEDPPVPFLEAHSPGGAQVFKLQAACPFRAFAELRLGAAAIEEPVSGLDARVRGTLVHSALQHVWQKLDGSESLQRLTPQEQSELVALAVDQALAEKRIASRGDWFRCFAELEHQRLIGIISAWLDHEKARAPFRVLAREQKQTVAISGLTVNVRVDRMDEVLGGNGSIILDYKTGAVNTALHNAWDDARPEEPQLPLYAVGYGGKLSAIAFAFAGSEGPKFCGYAEQAGVLPDARILRGESLGKKVERWRAVLADLAEGFRDGHAAVSPKDDRSCQYCPLASLCRIEELRPAGEWNGRSVTSG